MTARIVSAAQLLADAKPREPLLPDGRIPLLSDGTCTACGWPTPAYAPDGPDHGPGCPADREVWRIYAAHAALRLAAPDLAHTVIALEGERDAALARVARLERVLAVEAGDESQALEGWRTKSDRVVTLWHRGPWSVYRHRSGVWRAYRAGSSAWIGEYPSALEAMEAADAAGEVAT